MSLQRRDARPTELEQRRADNVPAQSTLNLYAAGRNLLATCIRDALGTSAAARRT